MTTLEEEVIPAFEKAHPGTEVKPVTVQYDQLHQKLVTAAAGGEPARRRPQRHHLGPELADLGVLVPLDQAMPDFEKLAEQTYDGPLATNKWQDRYYGLPLTTNTKVMLYNEQALDEAGVGVPETFDDLRASAPKVAETGNYLLAEADAAGWQVLPFIWSNGGDITDEDITTSEGYLNGPKSVEAIELLVDLYEQQAMPKLILGGGGGTNTFEGLAKGMYATITDGPWAFPIIEGQFKDFEMKTAPMPHGDGESTSVVGGENLVITQASENKQARRRVHPVHAERGGPARDGRGRADLGARVPVRQDGRDRAVVRGVHEPAPDRSPPPADTGLDEDRRDHPQAGPARGAR